jgi:hypothetical protein
MKKKRHPFFQKNASSWFSPSTYVQRFCGPPHLSLFSSSPSPALVRRGLSRVKALPHENADSARAFFKNRDAVFFSKKNTPHLFLNSPFDKGRLKTIVCWFYENHGQYTTLKFLEKLKEFGFGSATAGGISLGIDDLHIPPTKIALLAAAETKVAKEVSDYRNAHLTGIERVQRFISTWNQTNDTVKHEVVKHFEQTDFLNPIYMMAFSGARGNMSQVRQLVGMRGLMSDPQGQIIDFPIQSNFREGLTLTEYLISTYGARKGIVDTALRTATAGYLTRRLVDVAQHTIVSQFDCGTPRGIFLFDMKEGKKTIYSFQNRLVGRVVARTISFPQSSGQTSLSSSALAFRNQEIDSKLASSISKLCQKAFVRSPLTCELSRFVCQLCYGWSFSNGKLVSVGEAVGILAAQSIGEPGTQLTMRTFHTGGVFSGVFTDQIRAPFFGKLSYFQSIPGTCVRTSLSEVAFFTKHPGSFSIQKNESTPSHVNLSYFETQEKFGEFLQKTKYETKKQSVSEIFRIPAYALLFCRNNEVVQKKQILAQFSTSLQKMNYGIAEQTFFSNLAGEFVFGNSFFQKAPRPGFHSDRHTTLPFGQNEKRGSRPYDGQKQNLLLERKNGDFSEAELQYDSLWKFQNWSTLWILSGKIFSNSFLREGSPSWLEEGDFLTPQTLLQRLLWKKTQKFQASLCLQNFVSKPSFQTRLRSVPEKKKDPRMTFFHARHMKTPQKTLFPHHHSNSGDSGPALKKNASFRTLSSFFAFKVDPSPSFFHSRKKFSFVFEPFAHMADVGKKTDIFFLQTKSHRFFPNIQKKRQSLRKPRSQDPKKNDDFLNSLFEKFGKKKTKENLLSFLNLSTYRNMYQTSQKFGFFRNGRKRKKNGFFSQRRVSFGYQKPIFSFQKSFFIFQKVRQKPFSHGQKLFEEPKKQRTYFRFFEGFSRFCHQNSSFFSKAFSPHIVWSRPKRSESESEPHVFWTQKKTKKRFKTLLFKKVVFHLSVQKIRYKKFGYISFLQSSKNTLHFQNSFRLFSHFSPLAPGLVHFDSTYTSPFSTRLFFSEKREAQSTLSKHSSLVSKAHPFQLKQNGFVHILSCEKSVKKILLENFFMAQQKEVLSGQKSEKKMVNSVSTLQDFEKCFQKYRSFHQSFNFSMLPSDEQSQSEQTGESFFSSVFFPGKKVFPYSMHTLSFLLFLQRKTDVFSKTENFSCSQSAFLPDLFDRSWQFKKTESWKTFVRKTKESFSFQSFTFVPNFFSPMYTKELLLLSHDHFCLFRTKSLDQKQVSFFSNREKSFSFVGSRSAHSLFQKPAEVWCVNFQGKKQNLFSGMSSSGSFLKVSSLATESRSFSSKRKKRKKGGVLAQKLSLYKKKMHFLEDEKMKTDFQKTFPLQYQNQLRTQKWRKIQKLFDDSFIDEQNRYTPKDFFAEQKKSSCFACLPFKRYHPNFHSSSFSRKKTVFFTKAQKNRHSGFSKVKKGRVSCHPPHFQTRTSHFQIQNGWVYFPFSSSNALHSHQNFFPKGSFCGQNLLFEQNQIFSETFLCTNFLSFQSVDSLVVHQTPHDIHGQGQKSKDFSFFQNPLSHFCLCLIRKKTKEHIVFSVDSLFFSHKTSPRKCHPSFSSVEVMRDSEKKRVQFKKNEDLQKDFLLRGQSVFPKTVSSLPFFSFGQKREKRKLFQIFRPFLSKLVENPTVSKKLLHHFEAQSFSVLFASHSSIALSKKYHSYSFNLQKKTSRFFPGLSEKNEKSDIDFLLNFDLLFYSSPTFQGEYREGKKKFEQKKKFDFGLQKTFSHPFASFFPNKTFKNSDFFISFLSLHFFPFFVSVRSSFPEKKDSRVHEFLSTPQKGLESSVFPVRDAFQKKTNQIQSMALFSQTSENEKNSFFRFLSNSLNTTLEYSVCIQKSPFWKSSFSGEKKSGFSGMVSRQRDSEKKTLFEKSSSFWFTKTRTRFPFSKEETGFSSIRSKTMTTRSFHEKPKVYTNCFFQKNHRFYGTTKFFSPYEGELLPMVTHEMKWWEKASKISSLEKFNTLFVVVTKKDLFSVELTSRRNVLDSDSNFQKNLKHESIKKSIVDHAHVPPLSLSEDAFFREKSLRQTTDGFIEHPLHFQTSKQKNVHKLYRYLQNCFEKSFFQNSDQFFDGSKKTNVSSFVTKYEDKVYTFENISIGSPSLSKTPRLGEFGVYGSCFFDSALQKPGQILHRNRHRITLRRGQPFFVSLNGIVHFSKIPYIQKNVPIVTLPYQTVQAGDIVQGIPKVEQFFEARTTIQGRLFVSSLPLLLKGIFERYKVLFPLEQAVRQSFLKIQQILVDGVQRVYRSQGVSITEKHLEVVVRQMTTKVQILSGAQTGFFPGELVRLDFVERLNRYLTVQIRYEPVLLRITRSSLEVESFLSASSFQQTTKILSLAAVSRKKDFLKGLKENLLVGNLLPAGTGYFQFTKTRE